MDRRKFLGGLFAMAALASLPKWITETSTDCRLPFEGSPFPGVNGIPFKIRLDTSWFQHNDVLLVGTDPANSDNENMFLFKNNNGVGTITRITNNPEKQQTFIVEHVSNRDTESIYSQARKYCSVYEEL